MVCKSSREKQWLSHQQGQSQVPVGKCSLSRLGGFSTGLSPREGSSQKGKGRGSLGRQEGDNLIAICLGPPQCWFWKSLVTGNRMVIHPSKQGRGPSTANLDFEEDEYLHVFTLGLGIVLGCASTLLRQGFQEKGSEGSRVEQRKKVKQRYGLR